MLAVLVAGALFVGCIGTLLWAASRTAPDEVIDASAQHGEAQTLADVLVASEGAQWDAENGTVQRLGLGGREGLNATLLALLQGAHAEADPANGIIDYEEARQALALEEAGLDFRLRINPVDLSGLVGDLDLSNRRTAYIGAWGTPSALVPDGQDAAVVAAAQAAVDASMAQAAADERVMLDALGLGFQDAAHLDSTALDVKVQAQTTVHITQAVPASYLAGDVYPDRKTYLSAVLPARLDGYDLLVVGSGVQHSSLTADAVKSGVRDWVLAGGTLIVLGSGSQSTQWLQPLFHVGTATVNGGAYAPDTFHPMLQEPHRLAWPEYGTPSKAWDIQDQGAQAHADDFDHVITAGDGDILGVSRPGAFGQGRVLLTSYQPGALDSTVGAEEASHLLHNLVVYLDRSHLYLEYGAPLPTDTAVAGAIRYTTLEDEELGTVPVQVEVLVWRA